MTLTAQDVRQVLAGVRIVEQWLRRLPDWREEACEAGRIPSWLDGAAGGGAVGGPTEAEATRLAEISRRVEALDGAMAELEPRWQELLHLYYEHDLSVNAVCNTLSMDKRTFRHKRIAALANVLVRIWAMGFRLGIDELHQFD